jgi:hypothetical protein
MGQGYDELTTDAEKIDFINRLVDDVYKNISIRYDLQTNANEIKKIIKSYVKDKDIL